MTSSTAPSEDPVGYDSSSQAPPAAAQVGIEQLRLTARWLIAGFAAVGVTLLAGIQLSDVGKARPIEAAAIGFALGIVGAVGASWAASSVLRPESLTTADLATKKAAGPLRRAIEADPGLLEGKVGTLAQLNSEIIRVRAEADVAWDRPGADRPESAERNAALNAEDKLIALQDLATRLADYALYLDTARRFDNARNAIVVAVIACATGIGLFAWSTSRPGPSPSPRRADLVTVRLNSDARESMRAALGTKCDRRAVAAVRVGGTDNDPEVVTIPGLGCRASRFVVSPESGQVTIP